MNLLCEREIQTKNWPSQEEYSETVHWAKVIEKKEIQNFYKVVQEIIENHIKRLSEEGNEAAKC